MSHELRSCDHNIIYHSNKMAEGERDAPTYSSSLHLDDREKLIAGGSSSNSIDSRGSSSSIQVRSDDMPSVEVKRHANKPSSRHLILAVLACTLGSPFQIGLNTGSLNTPAKVIKDFYNETYTSRHNEEMPSDLLTILWAITVASFCVGGMIGGMISSYLSKKFGRKSVLLWTNTLAFFCAAMQASSKYVHSYELLIAGRIVAGIMCGLNSAVAPTYLAEISPVALRGFCGTCNQLAITSGVLIAEIIGNEHVLGSKDLWPVVVGFSAVPAIYSLCTLTWCPESPRYLMVTRGDEQAAYNALTWLRGTSNVYDEMEAMKAERIEMQNARKFSVLDLWRSRDLRWPLIICLVLQLSQQLSGINAVIYYSTSIFELASLSEMTSQLATMGTGLINVLMTFVSALIMDRAGRRTLHLTGLSGMMVFSVVLVITLVFKDSASWLPYISVACVFIYIVFFATGPGSIPWFIVAEMFEQGPRTTAVSISVIVNWFANFLVGLFYPILQNGIKKYSFLPFSGMLAAFCIFTFLFVPETKGKTITEITMMFKEPDGEEGLDQGPNTEEATEDSPLLLGK